MSKRDSDLIRRLFMPAEPGPGDLLMQTPWPSAPRDGSVLRVRFRDRSEALVRWDALGRTWQVLQPAGGWLACDLEPSDCRPVDWETMPRR